MRALAALVVLVVACAALVAARFGGGEAYPDVSTAPALSADQLEHVLDYPEPLANVAVAADGRVFFTIHPESRPTGAKLLVKEPDGRIHPYPDADSQATLFRAVMGVVISAGNVLYTIDHGIHGLRKPRLLGFDLKRNIKVFDHHFGSDVAPLGSMLQDLQVDSQDAMAYIADVGFLNGRPALVVLDMKTGQAWRALEQHPSVMPQNWRIQTSRKTMTFFGGLVVLKPGVDGIAISKDDRRIVYGAMSHDTLYEIPTAALRIERGRDAARQVRALGRKPLNDGLSMDTAGNVFITDVEHGSVMQHSPDGELRTVIQDVQRIRWADALSFGPDGWLYVADSAIPDQMLRSKAHMASQAPYSIYRFKPGTEGVPGQ